MKTESADTPVCQYVAAELSAYLDGELTQQQSQRIALHIKNCPQCSSLHDELAAQRDMLKQALWVTPEQEELQQLEREPGVRSLALVGWSVLIFAVLMLAALLSWQFIAGLLATSGLVFWVQLASMLVYLGLFFLFLSVLRQRLIARKTDKYNKVQL